MVWTLLLCSLLFTLSDTSANSALAYSESSTAFEFMPMQRVKREMADDELLDMNGPSTFPPDYDLEDDNDEKNPHPETTEHTYYNMTVHTNDPATFEATYVDVAKWIKERGADGQTKHDHLEEAYRKAAGVRLKFEFPFYGHRLSNLTIATGGFLYVGDQTHSWLAATQYIVGFEIKNSLDLMTHSFYAPLMANFDTHADNSTIQYGDDGKRMIVEWREVTLRDNRAAGPFTFQVHLWYNGNISFVYRQVPVSVTNISDAQHPCKLGISDAYLFNHKMSPLTPQAIPQSKRVIHEYHRITVPGEKITSNTVVSLKALPTCLDATTCEKCISMQLKAFKCSWCNPKENGKGKEGTGGGTEGTVPQHGADKPFCSDQLGLHRRRQEWIEGNCQLQEENQYCKADEVFTNGTTNVPAPVSTVTSDSGQPAAKASTPSSATARPSAQSPAQRGADKSKPGDDNSSGGLAFVTLFMLIGISASVWLLYAYFNPHTRSGQLLIKYRPSKWQIPSSHVRYSASVHM